METKVWSIFIPLWLDIVKLNVYLSCRILLVLYVLRCWISLMLFRHIFCVIAYWSCSLRCRLCHHWGDEEVYSLSYLYRKSSKEVFKVLGLMVFWFFFFNTYWNFFEEDIFVVICSFLSLWVIVYRCQIVLIFFLYQNFWIQSMCHI